MQTIFGQVAQERVLIGIVDSALNCLPDPNRRMFRAWHRSRIVMLSAVADLMHSKELKAALKAWDMARPSPSSAPYRTAFDPLDCPGALPFLWIYQSTEDGFKCVLAGESVSDGWQARLKGKYLHEIAGPESAIVAKRFQYVLDHRCLAYGRYYNVSRNHVLAERFFVPLLNEKDEPSFVMGATYYKIKESSILDQEAYPIGVLPVPMISFYSIATGALIHSEKTQA